MNLCWFIGGYFFTFSEYFEKHSIKKPFKKISKKFNNVLDKRIINIFFKGDIDELLDEKYDIELCIANYFIPVLLKFEQYSILDSIPSYYFNFPFIPKNIFKDEILWNHFKNNYRPYRYKIWNSKLKTFHENILKKNSFLFIRDEYHVSVYFRYEGNFLKIC